MVLHVIEPQYRIDHPTMRDVVFANATDDKSWPAAVQDCAGRSMIPASAGQLWAFRLEANGIDHANRYFMSSTAAIYFVADGKPHVAFYDTQRADGTDTLLIAQAQEGYNAHQTHGRWLIDMKDTTLTAMLQDAEHRNRIVTPGSRKVPLNGAYANDASTTAILGE